MTGIFVEIELQAPPQQVHLSSMGHIQPIQLDPAAVKLHLLFERTFTRSPLY